ncbi:hypothetical protein [Pseudomonas sp. RT6P73]
MADASRRRTTKLTCEHLLTVEGNDERLLSRNCPLTEKSTMTLEKNMSTTVDLSLVPPLEQMETPSQA